MSRPTRHLCPECERTVVRVGRTSRTRSSDHASASKRRRAAVLAALAATLLTVGPGGCRERTPQATTPRPACNGSVALRPPARRGDVAGDPQLLRRGRRARLASSPTSASASRASCATGSAGFLLDIHYGVPDAAVGLVRTDLEARGVVAQQGAPRARPARAAARRRRRGTRGVAPTRADRACICATRCASSAPSRWTRELRSSAASSTRTRGEVVDDRSSSRTYRSRTSRARCERTDLLPHAAHLRPASRSRRSATWSRADTRLVVLSRVRRRHAAVVSRRLLVRAGHPLHARGRDELQLRRNRGECRQPAAPRQPLDRPVPALPDDATRASVATCSRAPRPLRARARTAAQSRRRGLLRAIRCRENRRRAQRRIADWFGWSDHDARPPRRGRVSLAILGSRGHARRDPSATAAPHIAPTATSSG